MCSENSYICKCGYRPDPNHKFCLKCGCPKIAEIKPVEEEPKIEDSKVEPKLKKAVTVKAKSTQTRPKPKTVVVKKTLPKAETTVKSKKPKTVTAAKRSTEEPPK